MGGEGMRGEGFEGSGVWECKGMIGVRRKVGR